MLGLDPSFPLKFMIYFLIVVAVGGTTTITGPLLAALLLGIADVAGKYYVPKLGAFIVYSLMIVILVWRPQGLLVRARRAGRPVSAGRRGCCGRTRAGAAGRSRSPSRCPRRGGCCRGHALLANEIAILALFAVSLDLILGYAGIVSLGHAAFFGFGAYAAALFAKHVKPDPLLGMAVAVAATAVLGALCSLLILRGSDLTRLMVTLGVASILYELANKLDGLTGGADGLQGVAMGPLLGHFEFDLAGRTAYAYTLVVLVLAMALARRLVHSPFGVSLQALRDNRLRAASIGLSVERAARRRVHRRRRDGRRRRRAARADHRLRLARRARLPPQRRRAAGAGDRRHRVPVRRDLRRHRLQAAAGPDLVLDAAVLDVLARPVPRRARARRARAPDPAVDLAARARR